MVYQQVFKTLEGVQKRVRFENAHSKRYRFRAVPANRFEYMDHLQMTQYGWRIERTARE